MPSTPNHPRNRWLRRALPLGLVALAFLLWIGWAERHPQQERELRVELQEQLEERFPAAMQPPADRYGIFPRTADADLRRPLRVVLVHGLDEPGSIWADLLPALGLAGYDAWEFRYPNDQGIDRSADLLASHWPKLPADRPVVLVGHSMGGLVIRDFVSRWRHPVASPPRVEGATVRGVVLAGTPNQGSEWSRMRILLEPRDQWAASRESGFSPLAGLQDGTGAAKIDLQPGSRFLADLNDRPWPDAVHLRIIGGVLVPSAPALGDGVVAADALIVSGAPPPILVTASHRGMLARLFESDDEPPAIPVILTLLEELDGSE
jgi:pimeloyl-ACP methyl ester carboxylesterase